MATIVKVKRVRGVSYQAKIKRRGRVLKTKTFRTKTAAREWARRHEADLEMELALGDPGQRVYGEFVVTQELVSGIIRDNVVASRSR